MSEHFPVHCNRKKESRGKTKKREFGEKGVLAMHESVSEVTMLSRLLSLLCALSLGVLYDGKKDV